MKGMCKFIEIPLSALERQCDPQLGGSHFVSFTIFDRSEFMRPGTWIRVIEEFSLWTTHESIRLFRISVDSVFGAQMKSELRLVPESEGALVAWKGLLPSVYPDVALQRLQVPEPERKVRFCHLYELNLRNANNCPRLDSYLVPQIWQG